MAASMAIGFSGGGAGCCCWAQPETVTAANSSGSDTNVDTARGRAGLRVEDIIEVSFKSFAVHFDDPVVTFGIAEVRRIAERVLHRLIGPLGRGHRPGRRPVVLGASPQPEPPEAEQRQPEQP